MLAAGASTRYGGAKQRELLPAVLARSSARASTRSSSSKGAHPLDGCAIAIVRCGDWAAGPGASLRCGLAALGDDVTHAVVVLADGPELDPRAVERLLEHADDAPILPRPTTATAATRSLLARSAWQAIPDEGGRALAATLVDCSDLAPPGDVDVRPLRLEDQEQLGRVSGLVRDVLGSDALGAYLLGSAVLGGLRPQSDLDVLVVAARSTTREEKKRLVDRLLAISGHRAPEGQWRRVELTIVVAATIKPWRFPPRFDFQYGDWLRAEFEGGNFEPWPTTTSPDLASLLTIVLLGNAPVFGPPPSTLIDPVPPADVIAATTGDVGSLLGRLEEDTRNVILTLARIWSTAATGAIRSKDAAAGWALERLPQDQRAVLARARAEYAADEEERWDDLRGQVRSYAAHVVAEIERLVP